MMARILIVDDEKSMRITLREFLLEAGHDVDIAEDAQAAQGLLEKKEFDVVVLDSVLPRVSGVEFLKSIRESSPRVQVVLVTGEPMMDPAAEAVRVGAFDYLNKPITKETVVHVVGSAARIKALDDERERLAVANREYQERLEQLVQEQTLKLEASNRQLQQALEELAKAQTQLIQNERMNALGQMASGIAHDFNNTLMPIIRHSEYFLSKPEALEGKEELGKALKDIHTAAENAREMVRRLKVFYRSRDEVHHQPVDLNQVVKTTVDLTKTKWQEETRARGDSLEMILELGRIPLVMGGEFELREALTNLILNAVDAMPAGGVIRIRTEADNLWVSLLVEDHGTGMTDEAQRRCFEPFFSTKGEKSAGLGLAMVHGIVRRHNGNIKVHSAPDKGTTFHVKLPIFVRNAAEQKPMAGAPAKIRSLSILVVDDEEVSCRLVARFLERNGHRAVTADSGNQGLERFLSDRFDVVVTDRAMPDMNGDYLASAIKAKRPSTRVILLTGFGEATNAQGEKPNAVDLVLSKPASQGQILQAVLKVMEPDALETAPRNGR
jgi:signal transduction histidine kinase